MDAVQAANSGHPGTPMALAPVAYTLWQRRICKYDPTSPAWPGRDRFVLSCGHASMLLYSLLHLAGVNQLDQNGKPTGELAVPLEHIKKFRQLHSRTPGHPEQFETTGVETTTGPLGQGCGNSVGMAIAQRWLAAHYNRPGLRAVRLQRLRAVQRRRLDGRRVQRGGVDRRASAACRTCAGSTTTTTSRSKGTPSWPSARMSAARFEGLGWNVINVDDANDLAAIARRLSRSSSRRTTSRR